MGGQVVSVVGHMIRNSYVYRLNEFFIEYSGEV
jgi:hypothetical protein